MNITFERLTEVRFKHSYFDGSFFGITVLTAGDTERLLVNYGLLLISNLEGFVILFDTNHAGAKRTRNDVLRYNLTLQFTLRLTDKNFYNYTSLTDTNITNQIIYLSNSRLKHQGSLSADEFVSEKDLFPYPLNHFGTDTMEKPFGRLVLKLSGSTRVSYEARFEARATYWRYIVISDYLRGLNNPAVIEKESSEVFDGPFELNLPSGDKVFSFISKRPLSLAGRANSTYQLVENYNAEGASRGRVIIRALPGPDIHHISLIPGIDTSSGRTNYSEIII